MRFYSMEILSSSIQPFHGATHTAAAREAGAKPTPSPTAEPSSESEENSLGVDRLTTQEKAQVRKLQTRDREVRAHEQAHMAAGSGVVRGGATYQYQKGPDGRLYAVGGEVKIDTGGVQGNPQATVQKAETIRRAALAPANPSGQDLQVAASATQMAATARGEIQAEIREEQTEAAEKSSEFRSSNDKLQQKLIGSGAIEKEEAAASVDTFV
ncbi:MAG: putative metalloprotease CJM1_0395 family protein [Candidatus Sedimenticola sp. (ex Thyasira tokunagai)]